DICAASARAIPVLDQPDREHLTPPEGEAAHRDRLRLAGRLELVPGGFAYRGKVHELTGKPRDMLAALQISRDRRCTALELREAIHVDDEAVTYPEQVVKDT